MIRMCRKKHSVYRVGTTLGFSHPLGVLDRAHPWPPDWGDYCNSIRLGRCRNALLNVKVSLQKEGYLKSPQDETDPSKQEPSDSPGEATHGIEKEHRQ